ncbi:UNVERIFIED_CONTAM: F-box protein [Sesamum radiatum]|uniref:F-box protein n=1 Tax=Sesamum radiatum TaxID=300843 RepID=A0AAW2LC16_SESRA
MEVKKGAGAGAGASASAREVELMEVWNKETVPKVMNIVSNRLPQTDLISLLLVSPWIHRNLISHPSLWLCGQSVKNLEVLNLNGCQKISDLGIEFITYNCSKLKVFSIYWNVRCIKLTDGGLQMILLKCSSLQSLNLYALSSFTDVAYKKISFLIHLRFLDLCGAQPVWNSWGYRQELGLSSFCSNTITTLDVNGCIGIKVHELPSLCRSYL